MATEKYESQDTDEVAVMPLAVPMIAGPGAITTVIVLTNEATAIHPVAIAVVIAAIALAIGVTYLMFSRSEMIVGRIGQREYRVREQADGYDAHRRRRPDNHRGGHNTFPYSWQVYHCDESFVTA